MARLSIGVVLLLAIASALVAGVTINVRSEPDLGGIIPAVVSPESHGENVRVVTINPGQVMSMTNGDVGGVILLATTPGGVEVGAAVSASDGSFTLVTPAQGPLTLHILETASSIPFTPGTPILVVIP